MRASSDHEWAQQNANQAGKQVGSLTSRAPFKHMLFRHIDDTLPRVKDCILHTTRTARQLTQKNTSTGAYAPVSRKVLEVSTHRYLGKYIQNTNRTI